MKIEQRKWTKSDGWKLLTPALKEVPQWVLVFGGTDLLKDAKVFNEIKKMYPESHILTCSTSGEILDTTISDDTLCLTAVAFSNTQLQFAETEITTNEDSHEAGKRLAKALSKKELVHAMVFSDGLKVNGTALVHGINESIPTNVSVTGGLVGDGARFKQTLVGLDKAPQEGKIVLVGFYGKNLKVGYGSLGGWDTFGPKRVITKSKNNVLFELDGKPALQLYKDYLGDQAKGLPGTGLLFPMGMRLKTEEGEVEVVRTLLAVDEKAQSMTFAGDMPEGVEVKLMKANFSRLIDGASGAASMSIEPLGKNKPDLAILISCIGRKLVLKERVEEEIEAVRPIIGNEAAITGFYSYGELSPTSSTEKQCQLHNQTMTITTFREA